MLAPRPNAVIVNPDGQSTKLPGKADNKLNSFVMLKLIYKTIKYLHLIGLQFIIVVIEVWQTILQSLSFSGSHHDFVGW